LTRERAARRKLAELAEQGGHVRADPLFGDQAVGDAVELVADVLDRPAGRREAEELAGVGAAEPQPDGDLVLAGDAGQALLSVPDVTRNGGRAAG
jgi:hypothetical protein